MDYGSLFIVLCIAGAVMLLLAVVIPTWGYRRWRRKGLIGGCLSLPLVGIVIIMVMIGVYAALSNDSHDDAMAYVRYVEEDRDCHFEERWFLNTDGTCYYEHDKGSHDHAVQPCGNDTYGYELSMTRVDSCLAPKISDLIVYFNLNQRTVTPVYHQEEIEVVSVDWEKVEAFFQRRK